MRRSSSTSGSRRKLSPGAELALFFGLGLATIVAINTGLQVAYQARRYGAGGGEFVQKAALVRERQSTHRPISTLFVGDSTVSVGVAPSEIGDDALNLAWSGFEPSEFGVLERLIEESGIAPKTIVIGMNPTFLSQNEWRNPQDLPAWSVARDALAAFYKDSNSFKPFLLAGGLTAFSNRYLARPFTNRQTREAEGQSVTVRADGLVTVSPERRSTAKEREDLELPFRKQNFEMLEAFRERFTSRGVRVVYLFMPYTAAFERVLREGPAAKAFTSRARLEIVRIFGDDIINLSGRAPDGLFRDGVHLTRAGAEHVGRLLRASEEFSRSDFTTKATRG